MFTLDEFRARFGLQLVEASYSTAGQAALALVRLRPEAMRLAVAAPAEEPRLAGFGGETTDLGQGLRLRLCPLDAANAARLRAVLPHLQPRPLGLATSAGCGDRLGLATPGHARAFQAVRRAGGRALSPIFAQQSIREMARTGRSPIQVLDDATWGAFQAGWDGPLGADADHLKTPADIDTTAAAGFSLYTIDPGEHVDSQAEHDAADVLRQKVAGLPWQTLDSSPPDLLGRFAGRSFDLGDRVLRLSEAESLRAAAKYGRAVAHVAGMYRHLEARGTPFELEVSVDETETPTTPAEHYYVAAELRRLGVRWVSLAPRFVGRFEKGVDYIGDLHALETDLAGHAAVARALGPYKLSLHSGSDKFSVYPLIAAASGGQVHLKTAGTSYLEALRTLAAAEPPLFREILGLARERYPLDRATYHVSAEVERVPAPSMLADGQLPALLEQFDARQVLHVTFGSVLAQLGGALRQALRAHESEYAETLRAHFERHLRPFTQEA